MSAGGYHAVLLAAGAGSRFGGSKLTASWGDGVLLDAALRSARAAPVESVVVVTGAHAGAVEVAVERIATTRGVPIRLVRCCDHGSGMSASLRSGLGALPPGAAGAFVLLGDMPYVPAELPGRLRDALMPGVLAAAPVCDDRLGHPVLIAAALFDAFAAGAGDGSGQRILRGLGERLVTVEIDDDAIFADVDTAKDLHRLHP